MSVLSHSCVIQLWSPDLWKVPSLCRTAPHVRTFTLSCCWSPGLISITGDHRLPFQLVAFPAPDGYVLTNIKIHLRQKGILWDYKRHRTRVCCSKKGCEGKEEGTKKGWKEGREYFRIVSANFKIKSYEKQQKWMLHTSPIYNFM